MKKAFTLVELIIAIAIFSLIVTYMYQAIYTTKKSVNVYENMYKKDKSAKVLKTLFYNDIFNQVSLDNKLKIQTEQDFSTVYLQTHNSLHNIPAPFVAYKVIRKNLFRFESAKEFKLPLNYENEEYIRVDKIQSDMERFLVYEEKKNVLIHFKSKGKNSTYEIDLPYKRKVIVVGG